MINPLLLAFAKAISATLLTLSFQDPKFASVAKPSVQVLC